jgi:hypothetical protein
LECAESVTAVVTTRSALWAFYHKSGPYMDMARNELVRRFYQPQFDECDRLLMIDSDIEFRPEDVRRLEADDLPIVSGVYHNVFDGVMRPIAYEWSDDRTGMIPVVTWPDGVSTNNDSYADPITTTDGVGAGFLMIRRDVLDTMRDHYGEPCPWFAEEIIEGVHWGEDLCFCLRAAELGFKTHVDRRVQVAHHKGVRLGGPKVTEG